MLLEAAIPAQDLRFRVTRDFVERHRKPDGAFGLASAPDGAPWPTFWALRIERILGASPSNKGAILKALASWTVKPPARLEETLGLVLCHRTLGAPVPTALARRMSTSPQWPDLAGWEGSDPLTRLATQARLMQELQLAWPAPTRDLLLRFLKAWRAQDETGYGYPLPLKTAFAALGARRSPSPRDLQPDHPSSLEATTAALEILRILGQPRPEGWQAALERWRLPDGGYGWTGGVQASLEATRRAASVFAAEGARPPYTEAIAAWLRTLRRADGGFAPGPGESSSLEATWQVMEIAVACGLALPSLLEGGREAAPPSNEVQRPADEELKLFQAIVEMGPPPSVAVELARRVGADLVLVKADGHESELARRMNAIARSRGLPLRAACGREEYQRAYWGRAGVGFASHASDVLFQPDARIGNRTVYESFADLNRAWEPVRRARGLVFLSLPRHRELLVPALEDSVARSGGWDAVAASWAFADDGDVARDVPWIARYFQRLAVIGNHDAHHECFHWLPYGLKARTLFFAKRSDFEGFRDAVLHRRTVAVAHGGQRTGYAGLPRWVERARAAKKTWDLGRNEDDISERGPAPLAVPLDEASAADVPSLREGFGLLVRAARGPWDDALPDEVRCTVDGHPVALAMTPPLGHEHPALWARLPGLSPGLHPVVVEAFGRRFAQTLRFGKPVSLREAPALPPPAARRPRLSFDSRDEIAFVRGWPRPTVTRGALNLLGPRTEIFLFDASDGPGPRRLRMRWRRGAEAGRLEVFVNGHRVQDMDRPGRWLIHVPEEALIEGFQRISLRAPLPPWYPGVRRNPEGPRILDIALEDAHE